MNTYSYKVTELQRDDNDIIVAASFQVTVFDGVDNFTHDYHIAFRNNPVTPVAFADLLEDKIIGWIKRENQAGIEESADAELTAYKKRVVVKTGLPWMQL